MDLDGALTTRDDGALVVHFERLIDRPVAKVWAALTEPALIGKWLSPAQIEPRVGGAYTIDWRGEEAVLTGKITVFEPERLLEYEWIETPPSSGVASLVRWELTPTPTGCKLSLTHTCPPNLPRDEALGFLGGWNGFSEGITHAIDDAPPLPWDEIVARWKETDAQYRAKYAEIASRNPAR